MRITRRTTILAEIFGWVLGLLGVAAVGLGVRIAREMRRLRPRL